ncbi:Polysaccharide pyruvyl transferase [Pseudomonas linyingensis]|uniref:Polysaccharide pyruvyl transferase n=1 Tax=Pseudomonas linyingensis TaxID=915471 RepID=A0A1H6X9X6_9PSED|nr:polysaccharide pyruvyl transferase family protein [Pseudomonas linyingensis]SEJ25963.1 Polysaccharide pyruvyl transferase [Pseudomonas linyingensis]
MKVLILNHCSHNKGDNSVLYYLSGAIASEAERSTQINLSSSDGSLPFWWEHKNSQACYWPGGSIFKSPNSSTLENTFKRLNFLFHRKISYKAFISLYSNRMDRPAKALATILFGKKIKSLIKEADFVFCTGGHHISNVLEKDCINPQLISLALADLYQKPPILWSQSIGPFNGAPSYAIKAIGRVFNSCKKIYVRDNLSIECVKKISTTPPIETPDSVFLSTKMELEKSPESKTIVCAIYTAGINDQDYIKRYSESWKSVALELVSKGYNVKFIPMQYKGFGGDERDVLRKLIATCSTDKITYIDEDFSPKETITEFSRSACVIGHKTHSVIYGLALGVPTVAIAYHEKTNYFMSLFGLEKQSFPEIIGYEKEIVAAVGAAVSGEASPSAKISLAFAKDLEKKITESLKPQSQKNNQL